MKVRHRSGGQGPNQVAIRKLSADSRACGMENSCLRARMPGMDGVVHEPDEVREKFVLLYRAYYEPIFLYMVRRISGPDVPDLVASVFVTAWRRISDVPEGPEAKLWLYGVARRHISHHRRRILRALRLRTRLELNTLPSSGSAGDQDWRTTRLVEAIGRLRESERESLRLVMWDGLTYDEASQVLGCSPNAVGMRLHKAKARLRRELSDSAAGTSRPTTEEISQQRGLR